MSVQRGRAQQIDRYQLYLQLPCLSTCPLFVSASHRELLLGHSYHGSNTEPVACAHKCNYIFAYPGDCFHSWAEVQCRLFGKMNTFGSRTIMSECRDRHLR